MDEQRIAKLSDKQRAFVEAYLANGFNATKAALEAGYAESGARVQGHRLLANGDIAELVQQRIKEMAMSADEALALLSQQAHADVTEFAGLSVEELKKHPRSHLLQKLKVTRRYIKSQVKDKPDEVEERVEYEVYNAQAAQFAILKEQHLRKGEATEIVDDARLTDEQRLARIANLLDRARKRRDGPLAPGAGESEFVQ